MADTLDRVSRAGATTKPRVVVLPTAGLNLASRANLVPPDSGPYDIGQLDKALAASPLDPGERMELKVHLRNAGLLTAGRPINDRS